MKKEKKCTLLLIILLIISLTGCSRNTESSVLFLSAVLLYPDRNVSFNELHLDEGDTIEFGYYNSKPLEWIVLQIEDGKMLVLSKDGLFGDDFEHRPFGGNTWKDSNIREFLNSEDLLWTLFTENEQALILDTEIETDDNLFYGVDGGRNTTDKLFLLSLYDVAESFDSYRDAVCKQPDGSKCAWWLRTPGDCEGRISYIDSTGELSVEGVRSSDYTTPGTMQTYSVLTIRPAMWIALDDYNPRKDSEYKDYEDDSFFNDSIISSDYSGIGITQNNNSAYSVGSTVYIGTLDGQVLEWTVLEVSEDKALVICNYGITYTYLNATDRVYTWETCDVRTNMNSSAFLDQIFTPDEQSIIVRTTLDNNDNPDYGTYGGASTKDYLFLLSVDEFLQYFSSPSQARCQAGRFILQDTYFDWYWWLRTPGMDNNMASVVTPDGIVTTGGAYANDPNALIRPAMWIKIV